MVNSPTSTDKTRSTATVHTSAKARLTSVTIQIRIQICDPDCDQNLITCSLADCQTYLKISCISVWKFSGKAANKQTNKQRRKHNLLGGGNKINNVPGEFVVAETQNHAKELSPGKRICRIVPLS